MYKRIIGKEYFLPIVITIVIIVSWVGVLDEYSDNYTDDSIIEAGTSYLIARGINGIVSVLQTSTVQVGAGISGSIAFGEVLDPVNDLIERFSHVMSLALGSLVFQKILLGISAHGIFKLLIAISGLTLIAAYISKHVAVMSWVSRIFLLLVFVRFSLVIVVSLNSIVDNAFITNQITAGEEELNNFRADIVLLKTNSDKLNIDLSVYKERIRDDRSKIEEINKTIIPSIELELVGEEDRLIEAEAELEEIEQQIDWKDKLNPFYENNIATEKELIISMLEQRIEILHTSIEEQEELIDQLREDIVVSEKRLAGEPVGLLEIINNGLPSMSGLKRSLSSDVIEENLTEAANNIFHLSALFILKTILIPLIFFFLFIKGVKGIWKMDLTSAFSSDVNHTTVNQ